MDANALRRRLALHATRPPTDPYPEIVPGPLPPTVMAAPADTADASDLIDGDLVPAAVLVPIVLGHAPGVLLTKRNERLKAHAGQVSFPGGRIDPGDSSPEATALREASEEIALERGHVELAGRLPDYVTGTGYRITPVLGLIPPGLPLRPSPQEVEALLELSLTVLLDPDAPQRKRAFFRNRWREFWVWPHPDHYIWGATAAILVHLARILRGSG